MSALMRELRFFFSQRAEPLGVAFLFILATLGVAVGATEVIEQRSQLARISGLQKQEHDVLAKTVHDPGSAAYYTFHLAEKSQSPMAFSALGQSDIFPSIIRIRALALEGQIYVNETINPELSLAGRFDYVFVLIYLAPLILIALLHDLRSREREASRLVALEALPHAYTQIFVPRAIVRASLCIVALVTPLISGGIYFSVDFIDITTACTWVFILVGFWTIISWIIGRGAASSASHASSLAAAWFIVTLVLPALANLAINAWVTIPHGPDIVRENREMVNDGWDLPKKHTMDKFVELYPEWSKAKGFTTSFHWKWYYAFQHLGDLHVEEASNAYRTGIKQRDQWAGWLSLLLPPLATQRAFHHLAKTDVQSQLKYIESVRAYHNQIRHFYYPYIFDEKAFGLKDYSQQPKYGTP